MTYKLQIFGATPFSDEIMRRVSLVADVDRVLSVDAIAESTCPTVVVFDHMADSQLIEIQEAAASSSPSAPILPVVWQFPQLVVGPTIGSHDTGCYVCFSRRRRQHSSNLLITDAVAEEQRRAKCGGPRLGYVAGHATATVLHWLAGGRPGNRVTRFSVVDHRHHNSHVSGVHACGQCGLGLTGETKTVDYLDLPVLAEMAGVR